MQVLPKKDVYQKNSLIMHVSNHHPLAQQLTVNNKDSDIGVHSVSINLIFHGEQAYISPNDVAVEDRAAHKVPTWNYSKVHVKAKACAVFNQDEKYALMEQSTNYFERANNNPWLLTDVPKKAIEQMFKAITFVNVSITDIEGSFKLSQNKPRKVIEQIAEQLTRNSHADLAKQMLAQPT
jgi:transcriptional regulator